MTATSTAPDTVLTAQRPPMWRRRVRGRVMVLLCAFYALSYLDRASISTAMPSIATALDLSTQQQGYVFSAFAIPYALLQIGGGWLGDKIGARRTLTALCVVWAVATVLTGAATGFALLFAARLLLGLGESAGFPTATASMARWLPAQLRGNGQGVVHAASRLANALAPLVVAGLITVSSWRVSFVATGVLSLVWAAVWWVTSRDTPRDHPRVTSVELAELEDGDAAMTRRARRTPWRTIVPAMLPVTITDFCYGWLLWVYITWLPTVFSDDFGLSLGHFAAYTTVVLLAGVLGDLVGGQVADRLATAGRPLRWARRLPLVVGLGGSGLALVPGLLDHSLVAVTISLAAAFFFLEVTNSTLWALPMDIAPDHAGAASGLMNTGFGVAGILSPIVFARVLSLPGATWRWPMALSVALLAVGVLVALRIDPRRRTVADPV